MAPTTTGGDLGTIPTVWTIGHGDRPFAEFAAALAAFDIAEVWDIRSAPGSRRHPQYSRDALLAAIGDLGLRYRHVPELGGWRRAPESASTAYWRHPSFRGYAAYMGTAPFMDAMAELAEAATDRHLALLCAERLPWRCHRWLVADSAVLVYNLAVVHILDRRSTRMHTATAAARVVDGHLEYPGGPVASASSQQDNTSEPVR